MDGEEYDTEENVPDEAGDPPRNEPMNGLEGDALGHSECAEVKKADRGEQEREPEKVQRLHEWPKSKLMVLHEFMKFGASNPHLPRFHFHGAIPSRYNTAGMPSISHLWV
jgi:hypothetical protein